MCVMVFPFHHPRDVKYLVNYLNYPKERQIDRLRLDRDGTKVVVLQLFTASCGLSRLFYSSAADGHTYHLYGLKSGGMFS